MCNCSRPPSIHKVHDSLRFVVATAAVLTASLTASPAWSQPRGQQADRPSAMQRGAREFRPGAWSRLEELPRGRVRNRLEQLPAQARQRALDALRKAHFPEQDLVESLQIDDSGGVLYADSFPVEAPGNSQWVASEAASAASALPVAPFPTSLNFHSRPESENVVYLDFDGETVTGTAWNSSFGTATFYAVPLDLDGDTTTFSGSEQAAIKEIWQRVAEDFAPFNVDVTTQRPATFSNRTLQLLLTDSHDGNGTENPYGSSAGGVAYLDVFNQTYTSAYRPAWCYVDNLASWPSYIAECASHEVGHNLSLGHDGLTSGAGYYSGHGSGNTSWAPIMGAGYDASVTEWSNGQYYNANNTQDDLAALSARLAYRPDDHGDSAQTATPLAFNNGALVATTPENDPANLNPANKGVLSTNSDVDVFSFPWNGGPISLSARPWIVPDADRHGGNLDILLELRDANGTLVTSSNPPDQTDASIQASLISGMYYLYVRNTGVGNPLSALPDGYTAYGSIGQYFIQNVASNADSDQDGIPDSSDNCTLVANPVQIDTDGDGYGNHCDGDLNNNGVTNSQDYVLFRTQLGRPSMAPNYNQADLNGNGMVNAQDAVLLKQLLGKAPGPSGLMH